MNLDQQALNIFLYMYAMKDDLEGFKSILNHIDIKEEKSLSSFKMSFNTACDANSKQVLQYILDTDLVENLTTDDFNKATVTTGYKGHTDIMCLLFSNEKILNNITFDSKLIYSLNQISNDKSFEIIKKLLVQGKYKVSKEGDDIFLMAKKRANEELIEYLFVNDLEPGEQLPKERMYEIILTKQEDIAPIFLNIMEKLGINFSENDLSYLKNEKNELYILLEKKNLFDKLNIKFETKEKLRKNKI